MIKNRFFLFCFVLVLGGLYVLMTRQETMSIDGRRIVSTVQWTRINMHILTFQRTVIKKRKKDTSKLFKEQRKKKPR